MFKKIFYSVVRVLFNGLFFGIYGLHVEGRENIPKEGAIIVAPNHKSNFDPPIVGVAFKDRIIHYMAKEESDFWVHSPPVRYISRKKRLHRPYGDPPGDPGTERRQCTWYIS